MPAKLNPVENNIQPDLPRELLQLVSAGELSVGKMVEILGITYYEVPALAEKYGLEIGATGDQSRYALEQYGL